MQLVAKPATILATFGVLITAVVLGIAIHFIMDYEFMTSMMIGSIISSTDAAAVLLITRQNPLKRKIAATLNVESAANDPMAILLTLTFVGSRTRIYANRIHHFSPLAIYRRHSYRVSCQQSRAPSF